MSIFEHHNPDLMSYPFPHPEAIASIAEQLAEKTNHFAGDAPDYKAIQSLLRRLKRKAESIMADWPVQIKEADSQLIRHTLARAIQHIGVYHGTANTNRNPRTLVDELEAVADELNEEVVNALIRNSNPEEVDMMISGLRGRIGEVGGLYDDLITKSNILSQKIEIKAQQGYFAEQAATFRQIGLYGLAATGVFILALILLLSCQGETDIMKDYLDQERELVVSTYEEHNLTKETLGTTMTRFNDSCEGCLQQLFLNTLIRANVVRIVSVSFVLFLIAVGLKVFYNGFHNFTINMQRSNSLRAALELYGKAETPEAKTALMEKAFAAIFSHQPTGFNSRPPSNMVQSFLDHGKQS